MSSSSLWWPMCSTSVFSRLSFSQCLVNKPFHSPSISYCSCLPFATIGPGRLHRGVSSWHPSPLSSCWWGPVLLWTAAGSVQSWHHTPGSSFSHHHSCCCHLVCMLSTILTSTSGSTPMHSSVAITFSLGTVSKAFSRSTNPGAILPCTSSLFSTICLRTYNPSAVPFPFLNPCCSTRTNLLLFSWSLLLKPSPTVSVLGWVVWCPQINESESESTFLRHAHPLSPLPYLHCQAHPPLFRYPSLLHTHVQ